MKHWRLILDTQHNAAENMAIDEAMLLSCIERGGPPTIRIYSWSRPSISLGCLQPISQEDSRSHFDLDFCRSEGIEVVRRITGGRAVIHGADVTLSIALRETDLPAGCSSVLASHHWLMSGIASGLSLFGIKSDLGARSGGAPSPPCSGGASSDNADCFAHIAECDVRVGRRKAVGSAQVRKSGAILEQGSIPYAVPDFDTNRVFGRAGRPVTDEDIPLSGLSYSQIEQAVARGFEELLRGDLAPGKITNDELEMVEQLVRDKYATDEWTVRRNLGNTVELVS